MTDLQARAEAAADAVAHSCKGSLIWKAARDGALHALQSEGWRPVDAPMLGRFVMQYDEGAAGFFVDADEAQEVAQQVKQVLSLAGLRAGALLLECVDSERWSLRFDFGKGDEACHRMRAMADAFRALPAPPEGEGV